MFEDLPINILYHILVFLKYDQLISIVTVNKKIATLLNSNAFWKYKLYIEYPAVKTKLLNMRRFYYNYMNKFTIHSSVHGKLQDIIRYCQTDSGFYVIDIHADLYYIHVNNKSWSEKKFIAENVITVDWQWSTHNLYILYGNYELMCNHVLIMTNIKSFLLSSAACSYINVDHQLHVHLESHEYIENNIIQQYWDGNLYYRTVDNFLKCLTINEFTNELNIRDIMSNCFKITDYKDRNIVICHPEFDIDKIIDNCRYVFNDGLNFKCIDIITTID